MSNQKKMYLEGWGVTFNGDADCQKFIETQVIDKKTAYHSSKAQELIFEKDRLTKVYYLEDGERIFRELEAEEIGFQYQKLAPHARSSIYFTDNAPSYIGGKPPKGFQMPECGLNAPIQYLGKLSPDEKAFSWLPFDLHLIAPIYLQFQTFFVDYSDPMRPAVLQLDKLRAIPPTFEDLSPDFKINFRQTPMYCYPSSDFYGDTAIGHTGVPCWIQWPLIPTCPKTNALMKFVCQLGAGVTIIQTEYTTVSSEYTYFERTFDRLNFWDDGNLYVFFQPESKVACYIIQFN